MEEEIIYFYNVKDGKYYQSRYTHRWLNNLQQQCKRQKEIINKATEYIKERFYFNEETGEYALLHTFDKCNAKELLDILNEVSEWKKKIITSFIFKDQTII